MNTQARFSFRLLVAILPVLTCLLLLATPVFADDCLRDPLNAKDCERTPGYKQFITTAAVALGVTEIALANLLAPLWQGLISMDKTGKIAENAWNWIYKRFMKPSIQQQGADLADHTADILKNVLGPPPPAQPAAPPQPLLVAQTTTPVQTAAPVSTSASQTQTPPVQKVTETHIKSWGEAEDYLKQRGLYDEFTHLNNNDPDYWPKLDDLMRRGDIKGVAMDHDEQGAIKNTESDAEDGVLHKDIHLIVDEPVQAPPPDAMEGVPDLSLQPATPPTIETPPASPPPPPQPPPDSGEMDLTKLLRFIAAQAYQHLNAADVAKYLLGDKAASVIQLMNSLPDGLLSSLADVLAQKTLPEGLLPAYYGMKFLQQVAGNPELVEKIVSRGFGQVGQAATTPPAAAPPPDSSVIQSLADGVIKTAKAKVVGYATEQGLKLLSSLIKTNPQAVQAHVAQFNNNFANVRDNPVLSNGAQQALNGAAKVINSPTQTPGPEYWQNTLKFQ